MDLTGRFGSVAVTEYIPKAAVQAAAIEGIADLAIGGSFWCFDVKKPSKLQLMEYPEEIGGLSMCRHRRVSLQDIDTNSAGDRELLESVLREMEALADEAGDWRIHLPFEALVRFQIDSKVRAQYSEHFDNCSFCQKAMDAVNPGNK